MNEATIKEVSKSNETSQFEVKKTSQRPATPVEFRAVTLSCELIE